MNTATYHIKTFGCQMNVSDSERLAAFLEERGFKEASLAEKANLVIVNTCGVRQMAEDRVYGFVHKIHIRNPLAKIAVTGCISHRKDVQRRLKGKVGLFFQIENFDILGNWLIENSQKETGQRDKHLSSERISYLSVSPKRINTFEAFVPIMTGCNNFCAYCVVPYARGREISRPPEDVLSEVEDLVSKGYRHITLLGQNVNSYRSEGFDFSQLLRKINSLPGRFWLSFVSSHPKDMSDELIETISSCEKLCECVHLPLQSGSDEVIRRMNRHYTQEHYLQLIHKIRAAFARNKPAVPLAITTDIIVGFPGESRKDFLETKKVMKKALFDMAYFGQFSPRPGTAAWNMPDDVSKKEKEDREKELNDILLETALANNKKILHEKIEVLVEKQTSDFYYGKTRTLKNIRIRTAQTLPLGDFVLAKVTKILPMSLEAEI